MKIKTCFFFCLIVFISCDQPEPNASRVTRLPFYHEATFTPQWISPEDAELNDFHKISPFELSNQDGELITEKKFENKIYIADFFFTSCPGICPKMTENMAVLQKEFLDDDDVLLLSHSVTPERDSIPVLKRYAEAKGVLSHKWHLVTGTQKEIYKLGRKDYFVEEDMGIDKAVDEFLHTENFVLIDKKGHIRGIYNGLKKTDVVQLIADVNTLKQEK